MSEKENLQGENSFVGKYKTLLDCEQSADFYINMFQKHLDFYRSRGSEYENLTQKLKVTPENLSVSSREILEKFALLEEASAVESFNVINLEVAFLETMANRYKYESKAKRLKDQIEELSELTYKTKADIQKIDSEIISAQKQIQSVQQNSPNELDKLNLQIKSYENKLMQYITKYPWVDEPQYNLLSIHDEIKKLNELQNKVQKVEMELLCYEGLKPDLFLAKSQLSKIKEDYEEICKMISALDHLKL